MYSIREWGTNIFGFIHIYMDCSAKLYSISSVAVRQYAFFLNLTQYIAVDMVCGKQTCGTLYPVWTCTTPWFQINPKGYLTFDQGAVTYGCPKYAQDNSVISVFSGDWDLRSNLLAHVYYRVENVTGSPSMEVSNAMLCSCKYWYWHKERYDTRVFNSLLAQPQWQACACH